VQTNCDEICTSFGAKRLQTVTSSKSDNIPVVAPQPQKLTSFNKAELYVTHLEHVKLPPFEINKELDNSNDGCSLNGITYREPPVTTFVCGWFHVHDGKINSIRYVADIRQLLRLGLQVHQL
jgi:hypothetical protein